MALTQHQMKNIGFGYDPDAPLTYAIRYKLPHLVCYLKAFVPATSEDHAVDWGKRYFGTNDVKADLI